MILLIDNYDSFSYNLYQLVGTLNPLIQVMRYDACSVQEILEMNPEKIIISPGPGRPAEAGICEAVIRQTAGIIPILGVCLGHQAICEVYGGTVTYAKEIMHGKQAKVVVENQSPLFKGITQPFKVGRYHSLAADEASLPDELMVTARAEDGEIMAVEHRKKAVYGVQFHPESILTPTGPKIIKNFLDLT